MTYETIVIQNEGTETRDAFSRNRTGIGSRLSPPQPLIRVQNLFFLKREPAGPAFILLN